MSSLFRFLAAMFRVLTYGAALVALSGITGLVAAKSSDDTRISLLLLGIGAVGMPIAWWLHKRCLFAMFIRSPDLIEEAEVMVAMNDMAWINYEENLRRPPSSAYGECPVCGEFVAGEEAAHMRRYHPESS